MLALAGRIVTFDPDQPDLADGVLYVGDGKIAGVSNRTEKPPAEFAGVKPIEVDGVLYPGLIDLHSHILPGVDDGPDTLADSVAEARDFCATNGIDCWFHLDGAMGVRAGAWQEGISRRSAIDLCARLGYGDRMVALTAAETGHLILSTLHTIDASKTVDRIIGLYPKNEEQVIRTRLAQTFRYIISQRLIPRADGRGRVAAVEILRSSPRTREYVESGEGEGKSLLDAMRDGKLDGMQDFDSVIKNLIEQKIVTLEDGLAFATNQNNLLLSLKGLTAAEDFVRREMDKMTSEVFADSGSLLGIIE